jgi:hypothetical protein
MTLPLVKKIKDWSSFSDFAAKITLPQLYAGDYAFRGQADESWPLMPSLLRHFPRNMPARQR